MRDSAAIFLGACLCVGSAAIVIALERGGPGGPSCLGLFLLVGGFVLGIPALMILVLSDVEAKRKVRPPSWPPKRGFPVLQEEREMIREAERADRPLSDSEMEEIINAETARRDEEGPQR